MIFPIHPAYSEHRQYSEGADYKAGYWAVEHIAKLVKITTQWDRQ